MANTKHTSKFTKEDLELLGLPSDSESSSTLLGNDNTSTTEKEAIDTTSNVNATLLDNPQTNASPSSVESSSPKKAPYDGDVKSNDKPLGDKWEKMDIEDPAMVVEMFDANVGIEEGQILLHPWQIEVSEMLGKSKPTSKQPFKFCLCACNGSGKDAFVIAPFVIWFALSKIQSLTIITSSSGTQLTAQTEAYIRRLAEAVNTAFGQPVFKVNQRFIKCLKSGSEIRMFATDEEGKAEGYHPMTPNGEMAIIVNEAKSVAPAIFGALKRCTGFNYWLNVSTPGEPFGDFYKAFTSWPHKRHVSTFDCPHLSDSEREEDKIDMGEHSALYRSKHLALFTSLGGTVIMSAELIEEVLKENDNIPIIGQDWPLRIGGDLAAGGDENVLTGTKGNQIVEQVCFTQKDTMVGADIIEHHLLATFKIPKTHEHLYFDDGGVGRGIIDNLRRRGWNIQRILNQSPAVRKQEFGNRGAESWYRAKRIIEEKLFRLKVKGSVDDKLKAQLSNRYYKQQSTQGRITLEAKKDARAHGRPSPDRADSFLLSLTGLTIDDFLTESVGSHPKLPTKPKSSGLGVMTPEEFKEYYENEYTYKNLTARDLTKLPDTKMKPACGSLSALMGDSNYSTN